MTPLKTTIAALVATIISGCGGSGGGSASQSYQVTPPEPETFVSVKMTSGRTVSSKTVQERIIPMVYVDSNEPPRPTNWEASYGPDPRHTVDLREPVSESRGLVIFIHGGGWGTGDRNVSGPYLQPLVDRGYSVLAMNYRLMSPVVPGESMVNSFPAGNDDVTRLLETVDRGACDQCSQPEFWRRVQWLGRNGVQVTGISAGGHMAILSTNWYLSRALASNITCINDVVGLTDLRPLNDYVGDPREMIRQFLNYDTSPDRMALASPQAQLEGLAWPHFKRIQWTGYSSAADRIVPIHTRRNFYQTLQSWGAPVYHEEIPGDDPDYHAVSFETYTRFLYQGADLCFSGRTNIGTQTRARIQLW